MVRNIGGFAVFAVLAMLAFKVLGGIFGALIGLVMTLLWFAFLGFVFYTILKIFAPGTAEKIRDAIRGNRTTSA
jgi:predicted lipid-binding transport protein (Tim44 family)